MSFLDASAREELQNEASSVQRERGKNLSKQKGLMEEYYHRVLKIKDENLTENGTAPDLTAILEAGLLCSKGGQIRELSPASRKRTLNALLKLERSSEMVFMSFFHTVCSLLRQYGEQPPKPSEIMNIQKLLFGRKYIPTCCHNVALLAYTLGYLDINDISGFEKERLAKAQLLPESESPQKQIATTMLFEQYLDKEIHDLTSFHLFFDTREKMVSEAEWKKRVRSHFETIFSRHGGNPKAPAVCLERHGCAYMEDTLQRRVLDPEISETPGREWFLALALYMELGEDETNTLLHYCGYVNLGLEPWEVGLRYLLRNPTANLRERLDHRESIFAFLTERGFDPPLALFAAFPHLAAQPNSSGHKLLAALFLDCCADIRVEPNADFYADFYVPEELPDSWRVSGPDWIDIFSPDESQKNFTSQVRHALGLRSRETLPPLKRGSEAYQRISRQAKEWSKNWKPASPTTVGEQVLWGLPENCGTDEVHRRKLLYAMLLYILYTGHLPMKGPRFPVPIPDARPTPLSSPLKFAVWDEAETCRNMAASILAACPRPYPPNC